MRAAAFLAEVWMADSMWASVPTGQPRTGWPEATEMAHSDLSQDAWLRWFDTSARVTT